MSGGEWIALIGLVMFWTASIITFWVKIKIKLTELDIKINNNYKQFEECKTSGKLENVKLDERIDLLCEDNKLEHKDLGNKMDKLLTSFYDFKLYVEKNFKR